MSTQLRLVETPRTKPKAPPAASRRGRVVPSGRARVRWASDWRLDAKAREVGREGVATARAALARAAAESELPKAS
jgi:hypothetical protein